MKRKLLCLVLVMIIVCLSACADDTEDYNRMMITDPAGDSVELPEEITGVIARVNTASYLAAMGKADIIKATYKYMKNNVWADYLYPQLGDSENLTGDPSAESFIELGANLCIWSDRELNSSLRDQGISAMTDKPEDMIASIRIIASIFEKDEWAENWVNYYNQTLTLVNDRVSTIKNKKVVYYVHGAGNQGIYHTAAGGTISETWINISGGNYATSNTTGFGIDITPEALVEINPDVILIGGVYYESMMNDFYNNEFLANISAVKEKAIINVPVGIIPWDQYGIEYPLLCLWTAKTLYPDVFADIDMTQETMNFYNTYCGLNITQTEAEYILAGKAPDGNSLV